MKEYKKWSALALIVGMTTLFSSCAVHRHPPPPPSSPSQGGDYRRADYRDGTKYGLYHL